MKCLVITGGAGFLGRHVSRFAARSGWKVVGIGLGGWTPEEARSWGYSEWHTAHVTFETLTRLGVRPDAIVHCAGIPQVSRSWAKPEADFQAYTATLQSVLSYASTLGRECAIVAMSSASVISGENGVLTENMPPHPASPYSIHRFIGETLASEYQRLYGFTTWMVRFFSLYGPEGRNLLFWDAANKLLDGVGQFEGTGNEVRDWMHVTDAAKLIVHLLQQRTHRSETVNGGTGQGRQVREALSLLGEHLSFSGKIQFSGKRAEGIPQSLVADTRKLNSLGFQASISLEEGLAEFAAWVLKERELTDLGVKRRLGLKK